MEHRCGPEDDDGASLWLRQAFADGPLARR